MIKKTIIGLLVLFLLSIPISCAKESAAPNQPSISPAQQESPDTYTSILELYVQKATLVEAAKIIGITIPVPAYLPDGYEIQEIYVQDRSVRLFISDRQIEKRLVTHSDAAGTRQRYEVQTKMEMSVSWSPDFMIPVRLPEEKVDIKDRPGYLMEMETHKRLLWNWLPSSDELGMFEIGLEANREISKEELIKVAESVRFGSEPEIYTPQSDWVISQRLYDIKNGEFRYLCIYEDGSLIAIQMEGLRGPMEQHMRIRKTGDISKNELINLIELFKEGGFFELDSSYKCQGPPDENSESGLDGMHYSVSAHLEHRGKMVRVSNCFFPDGGETYSDMPYPLDEIYKRLNDIAENKTAEANREPL
jgi:hypothetical protein